MNTTSLPDVRRCLSCGRADCNVDDCIMGNALFGMWLAENVNGGERGPEWAEGRVETSQTYKFDQKRRKLLDAVDDAVAFLGKSNVIEYITQYDDVDDIPF